MKLHVLFMQRKESYPGEHGPEALLVIDEFTLSDCDPEFWERLKSEARQKNGKEAAGFADVVIEVDQEKIRERCVGLGPVLKGKIAAPEPADVEDLARKVASFPGLWPTNDVALDRARRLLGRDLVPGERVGLFEALHRLGS